MVSGAGNRDAGTPVSDKIFWHRYMPFYEPYFERVNDAAWVMEYGVDRGASISYLAQRFERAQVVGCDIIGPLAEWPRSPRIAYATVDQGSRSSLAGLLAGFPGPYDLVIEDGSHRPEHQANCLVATLSHVRGGGLYILEDLHTSHPEYRPRERSTRDRVNCYHLLLTFEHLRARRAELTDDVAQSLSRKSLFTETQVRDLYARIASVALYRRAALPLCCFRCGSDEFAYATLRCRCGTWLMRGVDSLAAVLTIREEGPPGVGAAT